MAKQPEQILENQLVSQLQNLGYALVQLKDDKIKTVNKQIEETKAYKKGLLQSMFV